MKLSGSGTRPLTVRVWTNLDSEGNDESFGIDNVIIEKLGYVPGLPWTDIILIVSLIYLIFGFSCM